MAFELFGGTGRVWFQRGQRICGVSYYHGVHVLLFSNHDKNVPDKRFVEARSSPHSASEVGIYSIGPKNVLPVLPVDISKTRACRVKVYDWATC